MLLAEDPFYTKEFVEKIVTNFPDQVVGAAFPNGFIKLKRIIKTFFIYGPLKFTRTVITVLYNDFKGGKVKNYLRSQNILIKKIKNVNDDSFFELLKKLKIDLIISNNCPQRLTEKLLEIPKLGSINLHLGKLPAYRGIFPVFHAIVNKESSFGITIHYMNVKFDDGPILNQETLPINGGDDLFSLYPKAFEVGADLMVKAITDIKNDNVITRPNGPEGKSYFSYPKFGEILRYHKRTYKTRD